MGSALFTPKYSDYCPISNNERLLLNSDETKLSSKSRFWISAIFLHPSRELAFLSKTLNLRPEFKLRGSLRDQSLNVLN